MDDDLREIKATLAQLIPAMQQLQAKLQETRDCLEKLAKVAGLEYSQDIKDWVLKDKLDQLRAEPR